ncbi:unnamed protein product [Discula destructiva]
MYSVASTTLAAMALFTSFAAAQSNSSSAIPTVNMFINDDLNGDAAYAASIVSACADKTVYALQCTSAEDVSQSTCGPDAPVRSIPLPKPIMTVELTALFQIATVTQGPSIYEVAITTTVVYAGVTGVGKVYESCALSGTTAASCTGSASVSVQGESTESAVATVLTGSDYHRFDVDITGGAEKTASATGSCNGEETSNAGKLVAFGSVLAAGILGTMLL